MGMYSEGYWKSNVDTNQAMKPLTNNQPCLYEMFYGKGGTEFVVWSTNLTGGPLPKKEAYT